MVIKKHDEQFMAIHAKSARKNVVRYLVDFGFETYESKGNPRRCRCNGRGNKLKCDLNVKKLAYKMFIDTTSKNFELWNKIVVRYSPAQHRALQKPLTNKQRKLYKQSKNIKLDTVQMHIDFKAVAYVLASDIKFILKICFKSLSKISKVESSNRGYYSLFSKYQNNYLAILANILTNKLLSEYVPRDYKDTFDYLAQPKYKRKNTDGWRGFGRKHRGTRDWFEKVTSGGTAYRVVDMFDKTFHKESKLHMSDSDKEKTRHDVNLHYFLIKLARHINFS